MKFKTFIYTAVFAISLFWVTATATAADRGAELYSKLNCTSCHGEAGEGIVCTPRKNGKWSKRCPKGSYKKAFTMYPIIAGQHEGYIYQQMSDILNGKRKNGMSQAMYDTVVKSNLFEKYSVTEADLKAIAKYLAMQKPK